MQRGTRCEEQIIEKQRQEITLHSYNEYKCISETALEILVGSALCLETVRQPDPDTWHSELCSPPEVKSMNVGSTMLDAG